MLCYALSNRILAPLEKICKSPSLLQLGLTFIVPEMTHV